MSMIGKASRGFVHQTFGSGFKTLGAGLMSGRVSGKSLSSASVMKGVGLISLGMLGTSSMFRIASRHRDRLKQQQTRHSNRQPGMVM